MAPRRTVELDCGSCGKRQRVEAAASAAPHCRNCREPLRIRAAATPDLLEACAACGGHRLYRQRDLDPRVGAAVVGGNAVISLALLPFSPLAAYAVLGLLVLVDAGFYRRLPDMFVCYHCKARHRGYPGDSAIGPFDLLTADLIDEQVRRERGSAG